MLDFSKITLVSVTGRADAQGAAYALTLSARQMPGAQALLFSPQVPAKLPPEIGHRKIEPLNFNEYSWFIMFALWRFVETDYVLIVQDDGWVLDGANWRDEYFEYDYLGAPGHLARVDTPQEIRWMKDFTWYGELDKPESVVIPVFNGGFSLRSRRLLRALTDHPEIKVVVPVPQVTESEPIRMDWFEDAMHEDVIFTCRLRPRLEALGFRFPSLDLAAWFSFELAALSHFGKDLHLVFGMHGTWRRLVSIDPPIVRYDVQRSYAVDVHPFEPPVVRMLEERGYQLEFMPEPG